MAFFDFFCFFFVLLNPLAVVPMFLGMTTTRTQDEKRSIAVRACSVSFCILSLFSLAGDRFLAMLKISQPALQISGGLLLLLIAIKMLMSEKKDETASTNTLSQADVAVFPLAVPLLAGPATLTGIAVKIGEAAGDFLLQLFIIGVLACVHVVTLGLFLSGKFFIRYIGSTGADILVRLFGLILSAIAVQMMLGGAQTFIGAL